MDFCSLQSPILLLNLSFQTPIPIFIVPGILYPAGLFSFTPFPLLCRPFFSKHQKRAYPLCDLSLFGIGSVFCMFSTAFPQNHPRRFHAFPFWQPPRMRKIIAKRKGGSKFVSAQPTASRVAEDLRRKSIICKERTQKPGFLTPGFRAGCYNPSIPICNICRLLFFHLRNRSAQ